MRQLFWWVCEKLCFLGRQIGISTGLIIFSIMGLAFPGSFHTHRNGPHVSLELNTMNAQHFSLGTLGMTNGPRFELDLGPSESEHVNDAIIYPKSMPSFNPCQDASVEHFSWSDSKLDTNALDTCHCKTSGFTPALSQWEVMSNGFVVVYLSSGFEWTVMEAQNLINADSENSNSSLPEPSDTCQEFHSVIESLLSTTLPVCLCTHTSRHSITCEIKKGDCHLKTEPPSSSHQKTMDKSQKFVDKQADSSANYKGDVNGDLIRSNNWYSNIRTHVYGAASVDKLKENVLQVVSNYVCSLKYNPLSLLYLVLVLADVMFGLMRRPCFGICFAITVVGVAILATLVLTCKNGPPAVYVMAHFLMFISLMLRQGQREWVSYLMAGAAYVLVVVGTLVYNISDLTLDYACVGVSLLSIFGVYAGWIYT